MIREYYQFKGVNIWILSKKLFIDILEDRISDKFASQLIWTRLFYEKNKELNSWLATSRTPIYWKELYKSAPQILFERKAAVHLTRSIPNEHKQSLKNLLGFNGYKISELNPRKTRRATLVNWLLSWQIINNQELIKEGPIPLSNSSP